jgi:hypothetical protein
VRVVITLEAILLGAHLALPLPHHVC